MSSATAEADMKAAEVLLEELTKLQPGSPSPSLNFGSPVSDPTILGEDTEPEPEAAEPHNKAEEEQTIPEMKAIMISTTNKSNFSTTFSYQRLRIHNHTHANIFSKICFLALKFSPDVAPTFPTLAFFSKHVAKH